MLDGDGPLCCGAVPRGGSDFALILHAAGDVVLVCSFTDIVAYRGAIGDGLGF